MHMFFRPNEKKIEKWAQNANITKLDKVINGDNVELRNAAFKAIGKCRNLDTINFLTSYTRHPNAEIRKLAAEAMGETGEERTLEFLKKLAKEDENEDVRETAKKSIAHIQKVLAHAE